MYYMGDWMDVYRQMTYPEYPGYGYPGMAPVPMAPTQPMGMEMPYGGQIYGPGSPLARQVLAVVRPLVRYFPYEIQVEGATVPHAILEIAAISYLMGRFGLPFAQARRIVESWEVNEMFPGAARISQGEEHA